MPATVKNIHVTTRWETLQKLSTMETISDKDPDKLKVTAKKAFEMAIKHTREKDEELSYVLFVKFCCIIDHIREKQGRNAIRPFMQQYKEALETAERLAESLQSRYKSLRETEAASHRAAGAAPEDVAPGGAMVAPLPKALAIAQATGDKGDALNGFSGYKFVACIDLYNLLHSRSGGTDAKRSFLIIDVRSSKDYEKSHIKSEFSINIPDEIIAEGKIASYYGSTLKPQFKQIWDKRKEVEILVLIDWSSTSPDLLKGSPLEIFKGVIDKWDPGPTKYKSLPHFLDGGYELFASTYPMFVTDSRISAPTTDAVDPFGLLNPDISYPNLSDSPTEGSLLSNGPMAPRFSNARDTNNYHPGMNHISSYRHPSAKPPSVDRSSKANAELLYERNEQDQLQLKKDIDKNKHKLDSVEHELTHSATKELLEEKEKLQQEVSELTKQYSVKEEENERLCREIEAYKQKERIAAARQVPKPRINQMTITDEPARIPASDFTNERIKPPDDSISIITNDDSHTVPLKPDEPSGVDSSDMKRSHSTPNIAQVPPQEWQRPPTYDRSTKPTQKTHASSNAVHGGFWGSGLTGLKNLGNTCYMNSIVQCISNTLKLAEYFCYGRYTKDLNTSKSNPTGGEVADKVAFVVRQLWSGEYKYTGCEDLKRVVGRHSDTFAGTSQQDSHEFLTFLMDWLHNDLCRSPGRKPINHELISGPKMAWNEFKKASDSFISELFFVQQVSTVVCRKCREKSVTYEEPTSNLTLQLPSANNRISLQDCLALYTSGEPISGYKCESCEQSNDAIKKVDIWRLPQILVIHLKRFYSDGLYHKRQTLVDFPLKNLDMREFTSNTEATNTRYDLYAVSNHYGTLEGGHYTAYCRNKEKWYKFDDQDVTEILPSYVKSANAYILFYEQVC